MKNNLHFAFVIVIVILFGESAAIFADVSTANPTKSYSATSSLSNRSLKEPAITNEAEYGDFVRRQELSASSVKSASNSVQSYKASSTSSNVNKK